MVSSFEAYSIWIVTVLQSWMHCYNGITHPPFGSSFLHSQQQMHCWIVTKWVISFTHFQTITLPSRFEWVHMLPAAINIQFLHEYATTMIPQPLAPILPFQVLESLHYHDLDPILATTINQPRHHSHPYPRILLFDITNPFATHSHAQYHNRTRIWGILLPLVIPRESTISSTKRLFWEGSTFHFCSTVFAIYNASISPLSVIMALDGR